MVNNYTCNHIVKYLAKLLLAPKKYMIQTFYCSKQRRNVETHNDVETQCIASLHQFFNISIYFF